MSAKCKETLKNSENRCNSGSNGGGASMRWSVVPFWSRNNKVYGSKAVDYELSEGYKEIHERAIFPNET